MIAVVCALAAAAAGVAWWARRRRRWQPPELHVDAGKRWGRDRFRERNEG